VKGTLFVGGDDSVATTPSVAALVAAGTPFWLDLDGVDEEASRLLRDTMGFHTLAVEDTEKFGQRPKIDEFDDFTYFVVHGPLIAERSHERGAAPAASPAISEVHLFVGVSSVVTVHRGECPVIKEVRQHVESRRPPDGASLQVTLLYLIVDALVDGFFPVLSEFDDRIDQLEDEILRQPTEQQLGVLFDMKRSLIALRKVVTPQRDMFAGLTSGVLQLPGMTTESERYFRDLYDHLIRIADMVDNYRDLLSGVMDTHVSTVSNRLNVVMKQLTIIATVFLPLSFLTGFFGQNFSFLVAHISGPTPFLLLGLGLELVAAAVLLYMFRRRGWLGGPTT
jgi:magnesium transporter